MKRLTILFLIVISLTGCAMGDLPSTPVHQHFTIREVRKFHVYGHGFRLSGIMTLRVLRSALATENLHLLFNPRLQDDPVWLAGRYTARRLSRVLARETDTVPHLRGNVISLHWSHRRQFTVVVPNPINPGLTGIVPEQLAIPRVNFSAIGDRLVVTGPISLYSKAEKLLRFLLRRVPQVRVKVWLLNESRANNVDISVNGISTPLTSMTTVSGVGVNVLGNVLHQAQAVLTTFGATMLSRQEEKYTDTTTIVAPEYTTTAATSNTNNLLTSGYSTRTSGLTVDLNAARVGNHWVIAGNLTISSFIGGDSNPLAPEVQQTINFLAQGYVGDTVQLVRATDRSLGKEFGISSNNPTLADDDAGDEFSLWISLESVACKEHYQQPHLLPGGLRHSVILKPVLNESKKLFAEAEGRTKTLQKGSRHGQSTTH